MSAPLQGRIVAVCAHPTVDRTLAIPTLEEAVVRAERLLVEAAGKGVNVARTLQTLGVPVLATGFVGRREIETFSEPFTAPSAEAAFVPVACDTRQNLTLLRRDTGRDIHVLDAPMRVTASERAQMEALLRRRVSPKDWLVFAGSFPRGVERSDFVRWLRLPSVRRARVIVDTSGPMLRAALAARPELIKPNVEELSELVGRRLGSKAEAFAAARGLLRRCGSVLLSLGADGAAAFTPEGAWRAWDARDLRVVHTVGCGDALLAGFLASAARGDAVAEALRFAVACGSANAMSPHAALRSPSAPARRIIGVRVERIPDAP